MGDRSVRAVKSTNEPNFRISGYWVCDRDDNQMEVPSIVEGSLTTLASIRLRSSGKEEEFRRGKLDCCGMWGTKKAAIMSFMDTLAERESDLVECLMCVLVQKKEARKLLESVSMDTKVDVGEKGLQ